MELPDPSTGYDVEQAMEILQSIVNLCPLTGLDPAPEADLKNVRAPLSFILVISTRFNRNRMLFKQKDQYSWDKAILLRKYY
jgi:hypothetical protein